MTLVVAGLGCRRACSGAEIAALARHSAALAGRAPAILAIPWFRREEVGLVAAAELLGLPLLVVTEAALAAAQPFCITRSAPALAARGLASIAEGCALAAAGGGAHLILPRIASARATCAIARREEA